MIICWPAKIDCLGKYVSDAGIASWSRLQAQLDLRRHNCASSANLGILTSKCTATASWITTVQRSKLDQTCYQNTFERYKLSNRSNCSQTVAGRACERVQARKMHSAGQIRLEYEEHGMHIHVVFEISQGQESLTLSLQGQLPRWVWRPGPRLAGREVAWPSLWPSWGRWC